MSFQNDATGGISFTTPLFSFGTTTPAVNSGYSFDLPMASIVAFQQSALSFASANSEQNRGFLQNAIGNSQNALAASNQAVTQQLGDISKQMSDTIKYVAKRQTKGGCYITTAICEADGLSDDCETLQTLRGFRDGYMMDSPARALLVNLYYETAPVILDKINALPRRAEILAQLRDVYLLPAADAIKRGDNEAAFLAYVELFRVAATFARGE